LLTYVSATNPNRRRSLTLAVLALLTFAIAPPWLLPCGNSRELHWSWWQEIVGDSYALIGLAALAQTALKNLLPVLKCLGPGTASIPAAQHDQQLGAIPPHARDDAAGVLIGRG
jgi:hypothetical protein